MKKRDWEKELLERTEEINIRLATGEINKYEQEILLDELWAEYYQE